MSDPEATELDCAARTVRTWRQGEAPSVPLPSAGTPRYEPGRILGRGGMGEVLEAHDPVLRRHVAIKRVLPEARRSPAHLARFVEEAQVTAQLDHPGIVPIHELAVDADGHPYYVMKEVQGQTLADLIAGGEASLAELLRIFVRVCEAMAFAHSRGVIHRDLKPANVMAGEYGEVYVMDWGLATVRSADCAMRNCDPRSDDPARTQQGTMLGTPAYMSPEQAAGRIDDVDERADVYLLGGMLYEILTGQPPHCPHTGEELPALVQRILTEPVDPPAARAPGRPIPAELEAIARKALESDRRRRYPAVRELSADLQAYLDGRLVGAARYGLAARLWKWARRHRAATAAIGAALLAVLALRGQVEYARWKERRESRREVERRAPAALLARARKLAARLAPRAAAGEPLLLSERRDCTREIEQLQELATACAAWRRVDPGSAQARRAAHEALCGLAELAGAAQSYELAELSYRQALELRVEPRQVRDGLRLLARARVAYLARQRARITETLARAAAGGCADEESYRAALAELTRWPERQSVELLLPVLERGAAAVERAVRAELLSANDLSEDESRAGWRPIERLEAAIDVWLPTLVPPLPGEEPPAPPARPLRAAIARAGQRLELRARRTRDNDSRGATWSELLGQAGGRALARHGPGGARQLQLVCDALGILGDPKGVVRPLVRYLGAEWDVPRAIAAGRALARLAVASEQARGVLDRLAASLRAGAPSCWNANGLWWRRVQPIYRRAGVGRPAAGARSVDELLRRAGAHRARGDHAAAIADLSLAIARAPRSAGLHIDRGVARQAQGDLPGALADFSRAIELDPPNPLAHDNRGYLRRLTGDLAGALRDHTRAIELDPQRPAAHRNRGVARYLAGDLAGALQDCTRAIELEPGSALAHDSRGLVRQARGDHAGAIGDHTRAIALDPRFATAYTHRGLARAEQGDLAGAIADHTRAIELDPRDPAAHNNRGLALRAQGDLAGALADYTRAIALDPRHARAYSNRGLALQSRGDLAGAIRDHSRAIQLDPRFAAAHANRALAREAQRDLAGALADCTRAIALDPRNAAMLTNRGLVREALRDFDGAIADHTRAIALDPSNAGAYNNRGKARDAKGDTGGALADYSRAIALDPRFVKAYTNRGVAREEQGDLSGAIADQTRAIQLDPRYAGAYVNRGNARQAGGDLSGAIADYTRAISFEPRNAGAHCNRGLARRAGGDQAGAIRDFSRAIELDPKLVAAHVNRADARRAQGDLGGALADCTRAIALDSRSATAYTSRGNARRVQGDLSGAARDYAHAVELDPRLWSAWANLGLVRLQQDRPGEARAALEKAQALAPPAMKARLQAYLTRLRRK